MASEYICTANIDHRSTCGTSCGRCDFLLLERRRSRGWLHWTFNERRCASNWIPNEADFQGVVLAADESGGRAGSFFWTLVILLLSFNILDGILTARALSLGFDEANPLLAGLFEMSLPLGMMMKFAVVAAGAFALWRLRDIMIAMRGMALLTACYGAVVLYHLAFQLSA